MKKSEKLLTLLLVLLVTLMATLCTLSVKKEMSSSSHPQREHVKTP